MPTLFDSHDEFNEWFSKDIESHAEKQSGINEGEQIDLKDTDVILDQICIAYTRSFTSASTEKAINCISAL